MATLVINAHLRMAQQQGKLCFAQTLATGIGNGFVISSSQLQQLGTVNNLMLLAGQRRSTACGREVGWTSAEWSDSQRQRYDVLMQNMVIVPYQNVPLESVAVI
jgi:hypothetical protein